MATLGVTALNLLDWAKRLDPDGSTATIIELLDQNLAVTRDALFLEGNLPTGHRTTVRTALPTVSWRQLNAGVQASKSTTAQIDEGVGMLEAYSRVDVDLASLNGNTASFRFSEAQAFLEAMAQEAEGTMFYGNSGTDPEEFTGFAPRWADLSAGNAENILDAGGTGSDNSSIWLVVWGPNTIHGVFPKGSMAGLQHEDLGRILIQDQGGTAGANMMALVERFQWKLGLAVRDWRYAVRVANIDISNLVAEVSAADLTKLMIKAIHRIPNLGAGKPVFYMNRTVYQMLDIQRREDTIAGGGLTFSNVDGVMRDNFRGIPCMKSDQLTETEAQVT